MVLLFDDSGEKAAPVTAQLATTIGRAQATAVLMVTTSVMRERDVYDFCRSSWENYQSICKRDKDIRLRTTGTVYPDDRLSVRYE